MAQEARAEDTGQDMATRSVDNGGRVALTDQHLEALGGDKDGGEVILTAGIGNSIRMFSIDGYNKYRDNLIEMWDGVLMDPDWDRVSRQLLDTRIRCTIDKQGRLRIPKDIMDFTDEDDDKSRVKIIYRALMGWWEIWPEEEFGRGPERDDPFYEALGILSERARQQRTQTAGPSPNEA